MLNFIVQFFSTPAIVVGVVALVGLLVQRKALGETLVGTLKTVLGFLIIGVGAGAIVTALGPITDMFMQAFKIEGFVPFDELVVGSVAAVLGRETALILVFGFILNVLFARVSPWKYIYLTGHMMWIHAGAWAIALHVMGLPQLWVVILGSIVQGLYTTIFPAFAQPYMRKITGADELAFGHGQTALCVLGGLLAKPLGDPRQSAEEMKLPEGLGFFRDMAISMSLVMLLVTIPAVLVAGRGYVEASLSGGQHYILFAILKALGFTAGVLVLLQGVRMFIAEVVPAFRGIAEKIVPGARPALDCPVIYPYAPTALMIGFIMGCIGQICGMAVTWALAWPVPLPNMIAAFFASGSGAIFGNAVGGRRGAVIGGFFWCFAGWLLMSFSYKTQVFGDLAALGAKGMGFACPDAMLLGMLLRGIGLIFGR